MPSPFPCRPVIREWLSKKTQIEKKNEILPPVLIATNIEIPASDTDTKSNTEYPSPKFQ